MSGMKFFFDAFSQPSRAVWLMLEVNSIPFQPSLVNIASGEHKTNQEFNKVSASGTIPAIDDNGFCLFESAAIMKYCVSKYQLPDHWYPSDIVRRAKIDEYLGWHSGNLRLGAGGYMFLKYIRKKLLGKEPEEERVEEMHKLLQKSMNLFSEYYLKDTPFINSRSISIADIQAVCEFTQFWMADIDITEENPRLHEWLDNCKTELNPKFDEVHAMIYLAREKGVFKK